MFPLNLFFTNSKAGEVIGPFYLGDFILGIYTMNYTGHLAIPQSEIPFLLSPLSRVGSSPMEGYLFLRMGQYKYGEGGEKLKEKES